MNAVARWPANTIHPWSRESLGPVFAGSAEASISSPASTVYPAANLAIYTPFSVDRPVIVTQLFAYNGASVANNIDVGIYTEGGTRLISAGSTAQAGTNTLQLFNIADYTLAAGAYYMAVALSRDAGTETLFARAVSVILQQCFGVAQQASAFPLPATATFASVTNAYFPLIGLVTSTVI